MEPTPILSPKPLGDSPPKPGDGLGPGRLRESLARSKRGPRGAYKCRRCGEPHGEGVQCRDGFQRPAPRPDIRPAEPLFTEANTSRLLRVPFTIAAVRTNCRIWLLDEKEEAELAASAVPCLNEWVGVSPKWAALAIFSFSLSGLALSKAMAYAAWRRQMDAELKASSAQSAPSPATGVAPATPPGNRI